MAHCLFAPWIEFALESSLHPPATLAGGAFAPWLAPQASAGVLPWLAVLTLIGAVAGGLVLGLRIARAQAASLELQARQAAATEELRELVLALSEQRAEPELARVEDALLELRGSQTRLEDVLLRAVQRGTDEPPAAAAVADPSPPSVDDVLDRVVHRALALGYERIQVVTPREELGELTEGRHELLLEARRTGVLFKGRATVQDGRVTDVELEPPYALFP